MKAELAKIATARKATTEVRATIEANTEVTVPVSLEYRVVDAGWDWLYEARLDTQTKTHDRCSDRPRSGRARARTG